MKLLLGILIFLVGCSHSSSVSSLDDAGFVRRVKDFAFQKSYEPLPGLWVYQYIHKGSDLKILLSPKSGSGAVAMATAYNVGSRFEEPGRTGLAHLFEHMMFRGTEHFAEPFKTLAEWGSNYNAFTTADITLYHELVPSEVLPELIRFEADRMRHLKIDEAGFNTERGAVVSERKMRTEDAPQGRLYWELFQTAFDTHGYKTSPIGWQEDLDRLQFADALDFYKRFYAPNRAVIALVGDFKIKDILQNFHASMGLFKKVRWKEPEIKAEAPRSEVRRKTIGLKTESVIFADAGFGKTFNDKGLEAASLFCSLLTDDKIGFLANELVETQRLARNLGASCSPTVDPGLWLVAVTANPGVGVESIEKAYEKALGGFEAWLSEARLEQVKMLYLAGQWASLRDPGNLAEQLASHSIFTDNPIYEFEFVEQLNKVTLEQVRSAFRDWKQSRNTRVIIKPSERNDPFVRNL